MLGVVTHYQERVNCLTEDLVQEVQNVLDRVEGLNETLLRNWAREMFEEEDNRTLELVVEQAMEVLGIEQEQQEED